jgi:F0F1-type ATP synthase assembly protein I
MSDNNQSAMTVVGRYMGIGILLPAATFAGYAIGYGLDYWFSTHFLRIVFLVLGTVAGFIQLVRQLGAERS